MRIVAVLRRVAWGLAALFGASSVAFLLMRVIPGDPARLAAGELATDDVVAEHSRAMGLDQPLPVQYVRFVKGMASGDWGYAYSQGESARAAISSRVMASVELGLWAFVLGATVAVLLAFIAVYTRRRRVDAFIRGLSSLGMSVPQFWLALMVLLLLSRVLPILPGPEGRLSPGQAPPTHVTGMYTIDALLQGDIPLAWSAALHLILPSFVLALPLASFLLRLLRANLLDVAGQQFMLVLKAKGTSRRRAYLGHALPNAALPTITAGGIMFAELMAGSVLTEKVFAWPGVGSLVVDSVLVKDFSVVQAFVVLSAAVYVLVNTSVDIAYGIIDPRTRGAA